MEDRPRNIRVNLIEPNRAELETLGSLLELKANPGAKGGRPATAYYLNEEQALLVCMFSRTANAQAVRKQVIDTFMSVRRGQRTYSHLTSRKMIMTANNELHTFDFAGLELRVLMQMGEPWFVAVDVCRALGFNLTAGSAQHIRNLTPDQVRSHRFQNVGGRPHTVISESGLYKLIMRSDKPEARQFQDWVTREVLPSIRKTGGYLLNEEARETAHADDRQGMPLPEAFAQVMAQVLEQNAEATRKMLEEVLARFVPAAPSRRRGRHAALSRQQAGLRRVYTEAPLMSERTLCWCPDAVSKGFDFLP